MSTLNGTIIGYDPGGNGKHGLAIMSIKNNEIFGIEVTAHKNLQEVIETAFDCQDLRAIGVDTLTCWSTGDSGWREADSKLRKDFGNRVINPNYLSGAMCINGMGFILKMREEFGNRLKIIETHPKVILSKLFSNKQLVKTENPNEKNPKHYLESSLPADFYSKFNNKLTREDLRIDTRGGVNKHKIDENKTDACLSALSAFLGQSKSWIDLHKKNDCNTTIYPCGPTQYYWPEEITT